MEEEGKKKGCTGHCEKCDLYQRSYCASQISLYNQEEIAEIKAIQANILSALEAIKTRSVDLITISKSSEEKTPVPLSEIEE